MDKLWNRLSLTPDRCERIKILAQYAMMVIASVIGGSAFTYFLNPESYISIFYQMYAHFSLPFSACESLGEAIKLLFQYSFLKYICATIIFLFSFSVLNHIVSQCILILTAFKLGFTNVLLLRMMSYDVIRFYIAPLKCCIYIATSWILLIGCFIYSIRMANYSISVFQHTTSGRAMISSVPLIQLFCCFLRYCVFLIFTSVIYGFLIFLL